MKAAAAALAMGWAWLALATEGHPETVWDDPGRDPWPGTMTETVRALADCGAPYAVVAQLAYRAQRGACEEGEVRDGDKFDLMLSAHGCMRNVVARIAGPGWAGKSRKTLECHDDAGNFLTIPEACNNGSYSFQPPVVSPPAEVSIPALPAGGQWWPAAIPGGVGVVGGAAGFPFLPGAIPLGGEIVSPASANVAPPSSAPSAASAGVPNGNMPQGMSRPPMVTPTPVGGARPPAEMTEVPPVIPVDEPWAAPIFGLAVVFVAAWKCRRALWAARGTHWPPP